MEALIAGQVDIRNRIIKSRANFKKSLKERITEKYVEVRIENLNELWTEFLLGHKRIMEGFHAEIGSSSYMVHGVYDSTQELCLDFKTELKTVLERFKPSSSSSQPTGQNSTSSATKHNAVKLPKIIIPVFSGKYTEWATFRDLFESLIHNNEAIDNVQKMHYLKGYLTGEAEQLLRQIPISNSNYDKCWECLKQRYNNKRYLCQTILKRFLSQKNGICESANFLKELIDTSTDCLHALKNIGIDVSTWDVIVIHLLTLKLDPETRKQWELTASMKNTEDTLPTFDQFKDFITNRFRALEFIETKKTVNYNTAPITHKPRTLHVVQSSQCPFCSESHKIIFCKQFVKQDVDSRRSFVQTKGLCFNCLGGFHSAKVCQNPTPCRICKRRHHSLLHPKSGSVAGGSPLAAAVEGTSNVGTVTEDEEEIEECSEQTNITSCFFSGNNGQVLLATAVVNAQSRNGEYYPLRALLDQGSQASFVTKAAVQYLGLKRKPINGNISGLGGDNNVRSKSMVMLSLKSLIYPNVKFSVKAFVLSSVTTLLPSKRVVDLNSAEIQGLQLADPNYHTPNKIDVLLGAEVYSQIIMEGVKKNKQGTLVAQATSLGWILSGVVKSANNISNVVVLHTHLAEDDCLKKFWELEADSSTVKGHNLWTEEEKRCEEIFAATTTRDEDGRYIVKLPFHNEDPSCKYGHSREIAESRFYALEKRLNRDTELMPQYKEVTKEYLQLGHMEEVPEKEKYKPDVVYLPHHAVVKQDRQTTKVRVVFDASCKGKNGVSLNDNLMVGPKLQPDLRHLVLKWRTHPIPLVSDIVKMYRQVKVREEDADFQTLLWRDSPDSELRHYRLLRVTFGTASAPYLAVKVLQQVAHDEGEKYPLAAERVCTEFYMDDLMTGCETEEEGIQIYREMDELLSKAGFSLQKWTTSNNNLLEMIKMEKEDIGTVKEIDIKQDEKIKILGLGIGNVMSFNTRCHFRS